MIKRKIDNVIKNSIAICNDKHKIKCLLYVSSIEKAKKYFNKYDDTIILKEYPFLNIVLIETLIKNLDKFSMQKFINYISSESKVKSLINVSKKILNCKEYYSENPSICFIDTGIKRHLDFCIPKNRIIKFVDLVNKKENPYDDNGHGTFVAGVCSGYGTVNKKYVGIAPNSNIVSIKALDKNGEASADRILEAMQWVNDNYKIYNIKVVCMSFGSEPLGINDPIMKGAEVLWNKGICVVAAAGNSGPSRNTIKSPGTSYKIITVGGFDDKRERDSYNEENFEIANFSSRGPAFQRYKPDVVAPSVDINSCSIDDNFYCKLSGTSVSAPMIAGIMSILLEKKKLKLDFAKRLLLRSSIGINFSRNEEGFGYPNVEKMYNFIKNI